MSNRRTFISGLGAAAAWPLAAHAQTGKRPVIGILALNDASYVARFTESLEKLGYVDGKSATIVSLYAPGGQQFLPMLADNLVRLKPDVVLADAASSIKAVMNAGPGIPIVGAVMGFPVEQGLIASFSHPGGNVTGMAAELEGMIGKLLEFGLMMVPDAKSMGLLSDPNASISAINHRDYQAAAEKRGIAFHAAEAHLPAEIDGAIRLLADAGAAFVCIESSSLFNLNLGRVAQAALTRRLPTIATNPQKTDTGILLSYGVDYRENYQRAATFVDKILKGAKPGELPVEFPTRLEMVINMKTAKALGLTIPPTLLATADEVIE
jgi:putative ABC transport system substrate-binding protein